MHHVMGVCCIVFDIDGMLFEFFMNFLNIEKKNIFFQYFMFSSRFMLFPTLTKSGGGGGVELFFYFNSFSFHILCYFQNIKKILKSAPSLTG